MNGDTGQTRATRGGRRPGAGRRPYRLQGQSGRLPYRLETILKNLPKVRAELLRKDINLTALELVLEELEGEHEGRGSYAVLAKAPTKWEIGPRENSGSTGRGGHREGSGAKPTTMRGILKRATSKQAAAMRQQLRRVAIGQIKSMIGLLRKQAHTRVGRPRNRNLERSVRRLRAEGLSWGRIKIKLDHESGKPRSISTYRSYAENS